MLFKMVSNEPIRVCGTVKSTVKVIRSQIGGPSSVLRIDIKDTRVIKSLIHSNLLSVIRAF